MNKFDRECPFKEQWLDKEDKKNFENLYFTEEKIAMYKRIGSKGGVKSINKNENKT